MKDHLEEYAADHALLVAAGFTGGKVIDHAVKNKVGMLTTDSLVSILKQHDQFPFSLIELRNLFDPHGLADSAKDELTRKHTQHLSNLQLANTVLQVFEEFERQADDPEPITSSGLNLLLQKRSSEVGLARTSRKQIEHILMLLSNPALEILIQRGDGYVLSLAPSAARARLIAFGNALATED